jgi:ribosome biogenesis protein UTP30
LHPAHCNHNLIANQVLKASKALLSHINSTSQETTALSGKKSLLAGADDEDEDNSRDNSNPIWLTLTTKKHITDQKRLKPSKISLPHPLNTSSNLRICLITADPQRTYKDLVASPAFPSALSARISKVVGVDKIRKKWTQYEAQRKLFAEHDIFLADDRIIIQLPKLLGKTFYKSTTKRPIPVSIQAQAPRTDGKRIAKAKDSDREKRGAGEAKDMAKEIEKAIGSALVHLSSSTNTAIKVGYSGMKPEELAENIEAVSDVLIEKFVVKKWRGVKALHVKGAETASLPIWLTDELWVDGKDVLGEEAKKISEANVGKKRKARAIEGAPVEEGKEAKKEKKRKLVESNDNNLDKEIAARKEKLKKQKAEAALDSGDEVPKPSKKSKKGKEIAL